MSLSKPLIFSQQEITGRKPHDEKVYEFDEFRLEARSLMLYQNSTTVALKPKVVETLVALVERHGEVVSKEELMDRLWGGSFVEESNLTQNIYLLRKVLGSRSDGTPFIENFARRGYRFNGDVRQPRLDTHVLLATHTRTQTVVDETVETSVNRMPLVGVLALAAMAVAAFGGYGIWSRTSRGSVAAARSDTPAFASFTLKRRTDKGNITTSAISRDGKFIAYSDSNNEIWLKNVLSDSAVSIMPGTGPGHGVLSISPDNEFIYLYSQAKEDRSEILKVPLFGGAEQRRIAADLWSDVALSPDGQELAFVRIRSDTGQFDLISAQSDGSGERVVATAKSGTSFGVWSQSTAWSPDSSMIACTGAYHSGDKEISVIRLFRSEDGAEISTIPADNEWSSIESIVWLPNSDDLLLIDRNSSAEEQIFRYTLSTGEWHRVTNDLANYRKLSVTADGKTVVTVQYENPGNLWLMPASGDERQAKQLTFGRSLFTDMTGLSWTSDEKIVYASNAGGKWEIWMIGADGTGQRQLTQNCAGNDTCSEPVVSPDGRYIVFQAKRSGETNIWRMDIDGNDAAQLTFGGGSVPSLTNDGQTVVYIHPAQRSTDLWKVSIQGGEESRFSPIDSAGSVSFSPDSQQMAFGYYDPGAKDPWKTCIAPVDAASPAKCFGISRSYPRWSQDGRSFYYLDHSYTGIWKQPLDGPRTQFVSFPGERTDNFAFSPNGQTLVVARSKPTQDIVTITSENQR